MVDNVTRNGIEINGTGITIDSCIVQSTAESGIHIDNCGDKETLVPSNVVIQNCDISKPALYAGHNSKAGIVLTEESVDVTVINNVIHNCQNSAIRYKGTGIYAIWSLLLACGYLKVVRYSLDPEIMNWVFDICGSYKPVFIVCGLIMAAVMLCFQYVIKVSKQKQR